MSVSKNIKFIPNLPAVTPSSSSVIRGSLLVSLYEFTNSEYSYEVIVNGELRTLNYNNILNLYNTYIYIGDSVTINLKSASNKQHSIDVYRKNYTTDDQGEDNGIRDLFITSNNNPSTTFSTISFTVQSPSENYNFEYLIYLNTKLFFTPTPTPTITSSITPTPTPSITSTLTNTPTPSITPTLTVTRTPNSSSTPTPTVTTTPTVTPTIPNRTIWSFANVQWGSNNNFWGNYSPIMPTPSITPTMTVTPSLTPSITPTQSLTPTMTVTPTQSSTPNPTPTPTPTSSSIGLNVTFIYNGNATYSSLPVATKNTFSRIDFSSLTTNTTPTLSWTDLGNQSISYNLINPSLFTSPIIVTVTTNNCISAGTGGKTYKNFRLKIDVNGITQYNTLTTTTSVIVNCPSNTIKYRTSTGISFSRGDNVVITWTDTLTN